MLRCTVVLYVSTQTAEGISYTVIRRRQTALGILSSPIIPVVCTSLPSAAVIESLWSIACRLVHSITFLSVSGMLLLLWNDEHFGFMVARWRSMADKKRFCYNMLKDRMSERMHVLEQTFGCNAMTSQGSALLYYNVHTLCCEFWHPLPNFQFFIFIV